MLVSHTHKFIFLKTAKTASTSVEIFFEPFCLPRKGYVPMHNRPAYEGPEGIVGYRGPNATKHRWYNHMPAKEVKEKLGEDIWNNYFKFCVVRNPFDRLVSLYFWQRNLYSPFRHSPLKSHFWRSLKLFIERGEWLPSEKIRFKNWLRRQAPNDSPDPIYTIDGRLVVDHTVRYEYLKEDVQGVAKLLSLPIKGREIPKLKANIRRTKIPYENFFSKDDIDLVEILYRWEIDNFGYKAERTK